jgi:hypothetical protein
MLTVDVGKGAFEELTELLVGRLERGIRQVDIGHELSIPAQGAPCTNNNRGRQ